jgi:hypothetical protein
MDIPVNQDPGSATRLSHTLLKEKKVMWDSEFIIVG